MQKDAGVKKKKRKNPYRNQLMLSEWLVDIPEDFEINWKFVVCPIGKRCLVISSRGTTSAYGRNGVLINNFPSLLPGGCVKTYRTSSRDYCILDCIYHEVSRTFHVLDVMCWGGHPVYDSDTEFRSYWKETKLRDEGERLSSYSRINPLTFENLIYHPCSPEALGKVLGSKWPFEVDGLLFVHKEAHYTVGSSPLTAWLKPHMIPDVLKIPVSDEFLSCAPTLPAAVMETSTAAGEQKKKHRKREKGRGEKMDSSPSTTTVEIEASEPITIDSSNH